MMLRRISKTFFTMLASAAPLFAGGLASFSPDAKKIQITADGLKKMEFGSGVRFIQGGDSISIGSLEDELLGRTDWTSVDTPYGTARSCSATYGKPGANFSYTLTLKVLDSIQAATLQITLHNRSDGGVNFEEAVVVDTARGGALEVESPGDWLLTPLMEDKPAVPLAGGEGDWKEAAMAYDKTGSGFLIGPTGPPEAFCQVQFNKGSLKAYAKMDGVLVQPGESRAGEQMLLCFEPPATATDIWTRWVAATHGARLHRGPVYGWCSWYDRTTKIDEAHVRDVLGILASNPNVFGKGVLQIDDGYQKMDGDWSGNDKFPSGMAALAKDIRDKGWVPGVWFAPLMLNPSHPMNTEHPDAIQKDAQGIASFMNANPFHPDGANWIVPDHPASKKFLFNIIQDARERGYGYIKIDFNGIGSRFYNPAKTSLQIFRDLYTLYREAAGEEMYILSCLGQPTRGVIGFIDAARVGPDSHPAEFYKCLKSVLRFQIYDDVWWQNDPDVSYLATNIPSRELGPTPQGEGMWRTWHGICALVGGTAMVSEPLQAEDCREQWRNFEIMRPASREPARLLTLGVSPENTIFGFAAERPFGDFAVWNLYNPSEGEKAVTLDFSAAGLPPGTECLVFDFWQNKVVARAKDSFTTRTLPQYSSELLRFTPVGSGAPVLVGSNLHLSIGATEIDNIFASGETLEIVLSDAGAQEGSLTFHSTRPLTAGTAENCSIAGVESLGDDLWRVDLKDRQWGKPQTVTLAIGKPVAEAAP
jgi:hypothetical protein